MLFHEHGLSIALACAVLAIIYGIWSIRWILAKPAGNARMQEIAAAIQEGARAYLNRQYRTIGMVGVVLFVIIGFVPALGWTTAVGFAIGAILYEALAGRPAFLGANPVEVLSATLHEEPPPLAGNAAVAALDRLIRRALAKRPSERPASAAAMLEELGTVSLDDASGAGHAVARPLTRLAVLPFRLLGFAVDSVLSLLNSIVMLPFRVLSDRSHSPDRSY